MSDKVTIDLITEDVANDEYVMYLIEHGPWDSDVTERLRLLQSRIYSAIDVAIDGHLAIKYPDSRGKRVRVQIDAHDNPPLEIDEYIARFSEHINNSEEYQDAIASQGFISQLRIVSRSQMGRGNS